MRICELDLKKDINTINDPADVLKKYGWNVIGIGMEAAVAEHPNKNYVLKLFKNNSNFKQFVKFSIDHKNNPHVPVFLTGADSKELPALDEVRSLTIPGIMANIPGTKFSFVRMEKLDKISEQALMKRYAPEMIFAYLEGLKFGIPGVREEMYPTIRQKIIVWGQLMDKTKEFRNKFISKLTVDNNARNELWKKLGRSPDESWVSVVRELLPLTSTMKRKGLDLDANNVMLRNNTLVIIDPFY